MPPIFFKVDLLTINKVSRITAILLTKPCSMALWRQLTTRGNAFGAIGAATATSLVWNPASPTTQPGNTSKPWQLSPNELAEGSFPKELALECKRFESRYVQLARPLNWTDAQTPAISTTPAPSGDD